MATVDIDVGTALDGFSGLVLRPGDEGYEEARHVHNGMVDKRPALILRCLGTADIVAAVNLAREQGLEVSIRGGGHNVAGKAVTDGGLMIDLSLMKGIHVDAAHRTARAQGAVTWAELNRETQLHGLAVTGGVVSTTGIAGLTLGGGFGWTMAALGLAVDNLLSVEIVTADGRVLTASDDENADLFWAVRGGGGNFGVVSSFEYRLHPVGPIITGGVIVHPFDAAGELLRFYRGIGDTLPDEAAFFPALIHAPDGSGAKFAGLLVGHIGPAEQAQRDLEPVLKWGSPLDVQVGPMPYTMINAMLDGGFPKGALNYWKTTFLSSLSDEAIDTAVARFADCPSPMSAIVLEHFRGAVCRIPVDATAVPHRKPALNFVVASVWTDPSQTDANIAWTRETYDAMQPFAADRQYVNYVAADDPEESVRNAYGENYDRLVDVKTAYDPENLFRLNVNIRPRT
jgi:FAD/FMN-containing dehydrogenase